MRLQLKVNECTYVCLRCPPQEPLKNQTGTSQGGGGRQKKSHACTYYKFAFYLEHQAPPPHTHTKQPHRRDEEHSECTDLHTLVLLFALPPWRNLYGFFFRILYI